MKRSTEFIAFLSILFLFSACNNSNSNSGNLLPTDSLTNSGPAKVNYLDECKRLQKEAIEIDSVLMSQTEVVYESANKAIKAFTDFATYCASDSLSPIFLIKTAQIARVVNNIPQAKIVLENCIESYPNFSNRAAAIFLLAQLYDEVGYLNDEMEARKLYQKIIDEYPKSEWAFNAKAAIQLLGKTDKQIIEEFTKKSTK